MKKNIILFSFLLSAGLMTAQTKKQIELFPLSEVRLLDSPFKQAQEIDKNYLLGLEADRLLAPYLKGAGLTPKAENYTNWENTGLDGHVGGHYLSALSQMYAATGDKAVKERLDYVLSELKRCQDNSPAGYLGGVVNGEKIWQEVARGDIRAGGFDLNGGWVPLYNIDKIYHGLRDAWIYTGSNDAKEMLVKLTNWMISITSGLTDEQMQDMLRSEHGGLNEVFADVYNITGEEKYLQLARRFSHLSILEPLLKEEDKLTGLHANTQIPKVIGYKYIADAEGNEEWDRAARYFWDNVTGGRTVVIGGNSVREHFHPSNDFTSMITEEQGPESCNTYNMLRLSTLLFLTAPQEKYIGYYEQAMYNHILSSQHPEKGGFVYFTPMRPGHYRVYSQQHQGFWCCVGTGLENHARYGELIYSHAPDELYVNMYIPSILTWQDKQVEVKMETNFPQSEEVTLTVSPQQPSRFRLNLRYPGWVQTGEIEIKINGEAYAVKELPGEYIPLDREWKDGDRITVRLPKHLQVKRMPDHSDYIAFLYGPFVLAAKTDASEMTGLFADDSRGGHIAAGAKFPLQEMPILVGNSDREILKTLQPVAGKPMAFRFTSGVSSTRYADPELIPFYDLHESRYIIYFPSTTPEGLQAIQEEWAMKEQERQALDQRTIDVVYPGEQQPESDHFFKGEETQTGVTDNRHWRTTRQWFSYQLKNPHTEPARLSITFYGEDETAGFQMEINGQQAGTYHIQREPGTAFKTMFYDLPDTERTASQLQVRFISPEGRPTPRFYEVRLVKE